MLHVLIFIFQVFFIYFLCLCFVLYFVCFCFSSVCVHGMMTDWGSCGLYMHICQWKLLEIYVKLNENNNNNKKFKQNGSVVNKSSLASYWALLFTALRTFEMWSESWPKDDLWLWSSLCLTEFNDSTSMQSGTIDPRPDGSVNPSFTNTPCCLSSCSPCIVLKKTANFKFIKKCVHLISCWNSDEKIITTLICNICYIYLMSNWKLGKDPGNKSINQHLCVL